MSITLPNELAMAVREKVASGEYASESEVIRDGLRVLMARDRVVERWLRDKVGPAYGGIQQKEQCKEMKRHGAAVVDSMLQ